MSALRRVIASQTLDYDFRYHTMLFHCEINVLVLSEMKSVLQVRGGKAFPNPGQGERAS